MKPEPCICGWCRSGFILAAEAKQQAEILKEKYDGFDVDKNGNKLAGAALQARLAKLEITEKEAEKIKEILSGEEEGFTLLNDALQKTQERVKEEEKINKQLGVAGGLLKGIS